MKTDVSVVIPHIPVRKERLIRAVASVMIQTHQPDAVHVVVDNEHRGATDTRNRGLAAVDTTWVAFVDDDDELLPEHLAKLLAHANETGADLVYPWFIIKGSTDPLGRFGVPFDADALRENNYIPVTVLVRTDLVKKVGGFVPLGGPAAWAPCEDWGCWLRLLDAGATFSHLPERTWIWNHWGYNTSGRGDRW